MMNHNRCFNAKSTRTGLYWDGALKSPSVVKPYIQNGLSGRSPS